MPERVQLRRVIDRADERLWGSFLASRELTTYSEAMAWRSVLTGHYGLDDWHVLALAQGRVVGCMGLYFNRGRLRGAHGVSSPLASSGGGFHAQNRAARDALLLAAAEECRTRRLAYCELRLAKPVATPGWVAREGFSRFVMDLRGGPDVVWSSVLRDKTRNQIRKSQRHGFELRQGREYLQAFSRVLHRAMKQLGSPSPGRRFFERVADELGDAAEFIVLLADGKPAAGALVIQHRGELSNPWAVTLREYRPQCLNSLLYWEIVKIGCARRCASFDLGRSHRDSGTYDFKRRLGAEEQPLHYRYLLLDGAQMPAVYHSGAVQFSALRRLWGKAPDCLTGLVTDRLQREII